MFNLILRILYCLESVIFPIVIYVHVLKWLGEKNIIGVNAFFLPIIFIMFMQVLFINLLPKDNSKMLALFISPWVFLIIKIFLVHNWDWRQSVLDLAFLSTSMVMIGFLLVLTYVSVQGLFRKKYDLIAISLIEFFFFTLPFIFVFYYYLQAHTVNGWTDWVSYIFYLGSAFGSSVIFAKIMIKSSMAAALVKKISFKNLEIK